MLAASGPGRAASIGLRGRSGATLGGAGSIRRPPLPMPSLGPAVVVSVLALAPGPSSSSIEVAVAPITRTGQASDARGEVYAARLDAALAQGLGRGDVPIATLGDPCQDRACWIQQARDRGSSHVVLPELELRGPDQHLRLVLLRVEGGASVASVAETCEICGEQELLSVASDLAAELIPRLQRLEGEPATLVLGGGPPGARVEIDGVEVGALPWDGELAAGPHTLRVTHPGHLPVRRSITASAGVREQVEIVLAPRTLEPGTTPSSRGRRVVAGSSLLAVGALGLGGGVGLFVLDGRPHRSSCRPEDVDINGECPFIFESTGPAVAATVVGGAALVAGAVLLILSRHRANKAGIAVSPARRGGSLAVRF